MDPCPVLFSEEAGTQLQQQPSMAGLYGAVWFIGQQSFSHGQAAAHHPSSAASAASALLPAAPALSPAPAPGVASKKHKGAKGKTLNNDIAPGASTEVSSAMVPLLRWKSGVTPMHFGKLLAKLRKEHDVQPPQVRVKGRDGKDAMRSICFNFGCQDLEAGGCDGWMSAWTNGSRKRDRCNRIHVDIGIEPWKSAPKSTLEEVWKYAHHSAVKEYLEPTEEFAAIMA